LREHILIINQWVKGRGFHADKGTRKLKGEDRDYAAIFARRRAGPAGKAP